MPGLVHLAAATEAAAATLATIPAIVTTPPRPKDLVLGPEPSPIRPGGVSRALNPELPKAISASKLTPMSTTGSDVGAARGGEDLDAATEMYVAMGFDPAAVPIAVAKFTAEDDVISYLLQLRELTDDGGGHATEKAAAALDMFKEVLPALHFLRKAEQLEQMGFDKNAIWQALEKTNGDIRKSIDVLSSETSF